MMKTMSFEKEELTLPNGKKITFFSYKTNLPLKIFKEETPSVLPKEFFEKNWISVFTGFSTTKESEDSEKVEEGKSKEKTDNVTPKSVSLKYGLEEAKIELEQIKTKLKELTKDLDLPYKDIPVDEAELLNTILFELYKNKGRFLKVIEFVEKNFKEQGATGTISILSKYNAFPKILFKWEEKRKAKYSEYFKFFKIPGFTANLSFIIDPKEYRKLPEMFRGNIIISEIEHPFYMKSIEDLYYTSEKNVGAILTLLKEYVEPEILDVQVARVVKTKEIFNELTRDYKTYLNIFENFANSTNNELIKDFVYRVILFPAVLTEITESFTPLEKNSIYYILNTFYLFLYDAINLKNKPYHDISQYFLNRAERFNVYKNLLKTGRSSFSDFYVFVKFIKNKYQQQFDLLEFCVFWNKYISKHSIVTPVTIVGEFDMLDIRRDMC